MKDKRLLCIYVMLSLMTMVVACGDGDIPFWGESSAAVAVTPIWLEAEPINTPIAETVIITEKQEEWLEAEEEVIAQQLDLLIQNLQAPEYVNEAVSMLFTDEWFETLMSGETTGKKNYSREAGKAVLKLEVGFDEQEQRYTYIWLQTDARVMVIQQTSDSIHQVNTQVKDDEYHGAFDSWICIASTGDVFHEIGTFEKGILVDDYTAEIRWGRAESDIMALWMMREDMEFENYTGAFAGDGVPIVKQLEVAEHRVTNGCENTENAVVYAYSSDGEAFLFIKKADGEARSVFTNETLGIKNLPAKEGAEAISDFVYANRGAGEVLTRVTPKPTESPAATPKPTESPTATPKPTESPTATPKPTESPTATPKPTESPTATPKPTESPTATPKPTESPTATPKPTESPTATPKPTESPTMTPTPTVTPEPGDPWGPDWLARKTNMDVKRSLTVR